MDPRVPKIKKLLEQNKTTTEIMEIMNIPKKSTYYSICKRNNLKHNTKLGRPFGSYDSYQRTRKKGKKITGANERLVNPNNVQQWIQQNEEEFQNEFGNL